MIRQVMLAALVVLVPEALIAGRATAQGAGPATRVRVHTNIPNVRPTGRLTFASPDSLVVLDDRGHAVRVLRANVTAVDTSVGQVRHPWQGLGIGVLAGGAAGIVLGLADGDDPPQEFFSLTASDKALLGGAVFGVLGGAVGLVTGALIRTDRWRGTSLDGLAVAAGPRRGGGVALSLAIPVGRAPLAGRRH